MPYTPPPTAREDEMDEDILSISEDEFAPSAAPATHQQVLEDVFTPPPFLLARDDRDVRRDVTDLALHVPAQEAVPEAAAPRPATPARPDVPPALVRPDVTPAAVNAAATLAQIKLQAATTEIFDRPVPAEALRATSPAPKVEPRSEPAQQALQASQGQQADGYAVGLRLLRISPVWLALTSACFLLLIFLLSWLYQPATQPETIAAAASGQNHSTNSTAVLPAPAAETAVAPVTRKAETPRPAPQPTAQPAAQPAAAEQSARPVAQPAPAARPATQPAPAGRFTVQVGSFNNPSEANERVSKLRASGLEARATAVDIPQRGTWHRVYVGGFATREEAARHASDLRAKGVAPSGLVVEVK
jgi:cell division protein FtsN